MKNKLTLSAQKAELEAQERDDGRVFLHKLPIGAHYVISRNVYNVPEVGRMVQYTVSDGHNIACSECAAGALEKVLASAK